MTTLPTPGTPYYGGGQVQNPANVIRTSGAPPTTFTEDKLGTLAVDNAAATMYGLASKAGGIDTWIVLGGGASAISTLTGGSGGALSPTAGNFNLLGTAGQITSTGSGSTITFSTPAAFIAPGSVTATTTVTATLGNISATNGNLVLSTAGNKLSIATGSNASLGTSAALSSGSATILTTAVTASSKIFLSRDSAAGTLGNLSVGTITASTSFTIVSDNASDTSTVNWLIIN